MTLNEMKDCAAETLAYFIQVMPEVPFTADDIIIEFAKKKDMAERAKALCKIYCPEKIINESQACQLNESIAANALIGRVKSAVIVRINYKIDRHNWCKIFFHEFTHIYCTLLEMDGTHFIDIYGSGHTPDINPENKIYDGYLNAGYVVWSEFIAQYYTLKMVETKPYNFADVKEYIDELFSEVSIDTDELSKTSFAMACAYLLTCDDVDELDFSFNPNNIETEIIPYEKENKTALLDCLLYLYTQSQKEKPYKITEEFIAILGSKFIMFKMYNSFY
jgi:hypothetical protein